MRIAVCDDEAMCRRQLTEVLDIPEEPVSGTDLSGSDHSGTDISLTDA